jgi:hypothetical protein
MTIKQQGGIFGRNPTFNDVTVDGTLTTSGNLTMSGDLTSENIEVTKATGTATPDPAQVTIKTESSGSGWSTSDPWGRLAFYNSDGSGGGPKIHATMDAIARASAGSYSKVSFKTSDVSSDTLTEVLRFEPFSKDVVVSNGNLVIETSGQGIDFSATSGTGTSELFDDYEEGTWTPVIVGSSSAGTGTYTTQSATYTKVGRAVTFEFSLVWTGHTGTGFIQIGGFPFNPAAQTYYVVQTENIALTANNIAVTARVDAAGDKGFLIQSPTGGGARAIVAMDTAGDIRGSGTYQV